MLTLILFGLFVFFRRLLMLPFVFLWTVRGLSIIRGLLVIVLLGIPALGFFGKPLGGAAEQ